MFQKNFVRYLYQLVMMVMEERQKGEVTLIASIFTKTKDWFDLDKQTYLKKKNGFMKKISLELEKSI